MSLLQVIGIIGLIAVFYITGIIATLWWFLSLPTINQIPKMNSPSFSLLWFKNIPLYLCLNRSPFKEKYYSGYGLWFFSLFVATNYILIFRIFNYLFWFFITGQILLPIVILTIFEYGWVLFLKKENREHISTEINCLRNHRHSTMYTLCNIPYTYFPPEK